MLLELLFCGLVGGKVLNLANDYATVARVKREGKEAMDRLDAGIVRSNWEKAKEKDLFYEGSAIIGPSKHWYSDGSLRMEFHDGYYYMFPKGMYYYSSLRHTCKPHYVPPKKTIAPTGEELEQLQEKLKNQHIQRVKDALKDHPNLYVEASYMREYGTLMITVCDENGAHTKVIDFGPKSFDQALAEFVEWANRDQPGHDR